MKKYLLFLIIYVLACSHLQAQRACDSLGQTPASAFPVCESSVFFRPQVPACGGYQIPSRGCTDFLTDINPYWYRFTCFSAGTLGFKITPVNSGDDYDWQIFDISNRNPQDVYSDPSLFVACNWSGESGTTGASSAGTSLTVCGTAPGAPYRPLFSSMPRLIEGHEYLMLISHFAGGVESGYSLSFGGGTASITDPKPPRALSARAICDGTQMTIKLNKKMKCRSLSTTGSELTLNPPAATVIAARGVNCDTRFDLDSLVVTLSNPLAPGNYELIFRDGTDGNTIQDNCNNEVPEGTSLPVTVYPVYPTPMDSIAPISCKAQQLKLVFKKPMLCSSIASDGSDFRVTGNPAVQVTGARGNCSIDGFTTEILVSLNIPITSAGNFTVQLFRGRDGNTLLNECHVETPAGEFLNFSSADTVNANFTYQIRLGCTTDTVQYFHNGANHVNRWYWQFDNNTSSVMQNPVAYYKEFQNRNTTLIVSNGTCSDTVTKVIPLPNYLEAAFENTQVVCPGDQASYKNKSIGTIRQWQWEFGNGNSFLGSNPPNQSYMPPFGNAIIDVPIRLIVTNNLGCKDTALNYIKVPANCYIAVPGAFTPNRDGLNDRLGPTNAWKATSLVFQVYNRLGQKLYETTNWQQKWDGTFRGNPQDPGTYVWYLRYTLTDTGQTIQQKGTTVLLR